MGHARSRCWLYILTDLISFKSTVLLIRYKPVGSGLFGLFYFHLTEQDFGLIHDSATSDGFRWCVCAGRERALMGSVST